MPYQLLADMVVIVHLLFILFVIFGGLLLLCWSKTVWFHLVAVCWAVIIEIGGWICPLTPLENWLRGQSDGSGIYQSSFVEHYLIPLIYPQSLTREIQWLIALAVVVINIIVYGLVLRSRKNRTGKD